MSELDDFLRWGAHAGDDPMAKDSLGNLMRYARFPYGEISWWIREYRHAQSQSGRR